MDDLFRNIESSLKKEEIDFEHILTDVEVQLLILSFAESRGDEGFTEDEGAEVIDWAQKTRINESILELVLKGFANINIINGEIAVQITQLGRITREQYGDGA